MFSGKKIKKLEERCEKQEKILKRYKVVVESHYSFRVLNEEINLIEDLSVPLPIVKNYVIDAERKALEEDQTYFEEETLRLREKLKEARNEICSSKAKIENSNLFVQDLLKERAEFKDKIDSLSETIKIMEDSLFPVNENKEKSQQATHNID